VNTTSLTIECVLLLQNVFSYYRMKTTSAHFYTFLLGHLAKQKTCRLPACSRGGASERLG